MQRVDEIVTLTRQGILDLLEGRRHSEVEPFNETERRQYERWPFPGAIEIWPVEGDGTQRWFATCRDISPSGLGMSCEDYFEPGIGLEIALHLPEATFCGQAVVRYCAEVRDEYMIGVEFDFRE